MTGLLLVGAIAFGQTRADRMDRPLVQRALISEALRGDLPGAIRRYQTLIRTLPIEDPLWLAAIVGYARAKYDEGKVSDARDALQQAIRKGRCEAECQQLVQHIAIDQESIRRLPVLWTFDNENAGLFHHWARQDSGELVAAPGALSWTTRAEPDPQSTDQLVLGFIRPEPAPQRIAFRVRSVRAPSWVRIVLEDEAANRFVTRTLELAPNVVSTVEAVISDVVAEDPTSRLNPSRITRVALEDLTGSRRPGPHTLQIVSFRAE